MLLNGECLDMAIELFMLLEILLRIKEWKLCDVKKERNISKTFSFEQFAY